MNKKIEKVCHCFNITDIDILKAVEEGADSINSVRKKTKAGMGCGRCNASVERVTIKALKNKK